MVNLKTMETALKILWFHKIAILSPEDSQFFNWVKILNLHLKKLDLNIKCVSTLGYNDLQIDAKSSIDKLRMFAMIAAAKFSIRRLALSDSDENSHKMLFGSKLVFTLN